MAAGGIAFHIPFHSKGRKMNFLLHRWDSYPAGMHMANIFLKRIHGGISRVGCGTCFRVSNDNKGTILLKCHLQVGTLWSSAKIEDSNFTSGKLEQPFTITQIKVKLLEVRDKLPSGELTWQLKSPIFNRRYIFKRSIFYCHVSLLEGIQLVLCWVHIAQPF